MLQKDLGAFSEETQWNWKVVWQQGLSCKWDSSIVPLRTAMSVSMTGRGVLCGCFTGIISTFMVQPCKAQLSVVMWFCCLLCVPGFRSSVLFAFCLFWIAHATISPRLVQTFCYLIRWTAQTSTQRGRRLKKQFRKEGLHYIVYFLVCLQSLPVINDWIPTSTSIKLEMEMEVQCVSF